MPPGTSAGEDVTPEQLSLARRLRDPKTIVSLAVPVILLVLLLRALPGFRLEELPGHILAADGRLLALAFLVY